MNNLNKFDKVIRFLSEHLPKANEETRKPVLFHSVRVGVYLYENGYSDDIVLAGFLHDVLEFSPVKEQILEQKFGQNVLKLIKACTKDDSISNAKEKTNELIKRCLDSGQDALIVKTADILDSFKFYSSQNNIEQLKYCLRNANAIFEFKPADFNDKIFNELSAWQKRYADLGE